MILRLILGLVLAFSLSALPGAARQPADRGLVFEIEGPVGPATSDYLTRGFERAQREGVALIVLRMDTPGGLDAAMRDIIRDILASPIPVAVWVGPSGARAASAGTYILYASHIAAMAPGTNLGAATPVAIGGLPGTPPSEPGEGEDGEQGAEKPPARPGMMDKVMNDAAAFIRALARMRGRNADWAEKAVREAASLSAEEALELGVIDLVARDLAELLEKIDGRVVEIGRERIELATAGLELETVAPDWRARLLQILTNPNVAYILMLIGIYGIILEFYSPGLTGPGLIGAISLLLALYAFQVLPVNFAGLALVALGAGLLVAEAFIGSFGVLGVAGIAALVAGAVMLMDTEAPGFTISLWLVGGVAAGLGSLLLMAMAMIARSRFRRVAIGPERIRGTLAEVQSWSGRHGVVRFEGEIWEARSSRVLRPGMRVRVTGREGLVLIVEPLTQGE